MKPTQDIRFYKLSGAGNTFAMVDARVSSPIASWESFYQKPREDWVPRLCHPQTGLGVDGVLFFHEGQGGSDFTWDFLNSDGSRAEFCGNAARCAGLFAQEIFGTSADRPVQFTTSAGLVRVSESLDHRWVVEMPPRRANPVAKTLIVDGVDYPGFSINTGVPHFVVFVEDDRDLTREVCSALRHHEDWGPAGSNITILKRRTSYSGAAKTFERGVEDFTAACGTGAVAAALTLANQKPGSYRIAMPGGELEVVWDGDHSRLIGPAVMIGEFRPFKEMWE